MSSVDGCNVGGRKQETFLSHNNNNNNNNNNNVPVVAERRPQKQHKITKYKPNITKQLNCKYKRDITENVLSYILNYASK